MIIGVIYWGKNMEELDYDTLSFIDSSIQRMIAREKDYQKRVDNKPWEMLLFENRKLILMELQYEVIQREMRNIKRDKDG